MAINLLLMVHQEKKINADHTRGKFLSCYLLLSYCCLIKKGWNTNPNANCLIKYLIQIQYRNWTETGQSKIIYYYTCQNLKFPDSINIASQFVLLFSLLNKMFLGLFLIELITSGFPCTRLFNTWIHLSCVASILQ